MPHKVSKQDINPGQHSLFGCLSVSTETLARYNILEIVEEKWLPGRC